MTDQLLILILTKQTNKQTKIRKMKRRPGKRSEKLQERSQTDEAETLQSPDQMSSENSTSVYVFGNNIRL
jgi:hypothetical protein